LCIRIISWLYCQLLDFSKGHHFLEGSVSTISLSHRVLQSSQRGVCNFFGVIIWIAFIGRWIEKMLKSSFSSRKIIVLYFLILIEHNRLKLLNLFLSKLYCCVHYLANIGSQRSLSSYGSLWNITRLVQLLGIVHYCLGRYATGLQSSG